MMGPAPPDRHARVMVFPLRRPRLTGMVTTVSHTSERDASSCPGRLATLNVPCAAFDARRPRFTFVAMTPRTVTERIVPTTPGAILHETGTEMPRDAHRSHSCFFPGAAPTLFWEDWAREAGALADAPLAWACGDLHLRELRRLSRDNGLVSRPERLRRSRTCAGDRRRCPVLTNTHLAASFPSALGRRRHTAVRRVPSAAYVAALIDGKALCVELATATGMVRDLLRNAQNRRRRDLLREDGDGSRGRLRIDGQRIEALTRDERGASPNAFTSSPSRRVARQPIRVPFQVLDGGQADRRHLQHQGSPLRRFSRAGARGFPRTAPPRPQAGQHVVACRELTVPHIPR